MIVAAVSYLNTIPFVWGIEKVALRLSNSGLQGRGLQLLLRVPSMCAQMAVDGEVDLALVPTAEIVNIKNGVVVTDFCISAEGEVETVAILSNAKCVGDINKIYLDKDSKTSVALAKVLARESWGIDPVWVDCVVEDVVERVEMGEAVLAIGDKVFEIQKKFSLKVDLAVEWKKMTGLPFVFAAWVACSKVGEENQQILNMALRFGVSHIEDAVQEYAKDKSYAVKYLTENIKFNMTDQKRESMELFWQHIKPG